MRGVTAKRLRKHSEFTGMKYKTVKKIWKLLDKKRKRRWSRMIEQWKTAPERRES